MSQDEDELKTVPELSTFDAKTFVDMQTAEMRRVLGNERAMIACSGGVDSTTCAILTHRALGENLVCVFIDTCFMRSNEPKRVVETLSGSPLCLPIKLVNAKRRFMKALRGLEDAEEKRKTFRETFYVVLGEAAREEGCRFLVQGTIAPDWIETKGGIKTQHNVLEQIGINPVQKYGFHVVEPLAFLYKDQVRVIARYLRVPSMISERQPFPGPGLSVRVVGKVTPRKLETLKKATAIVEETLKEFKPEQYFAVIIHDEGERHPAIARLRDAAATSLKVPRRLVKVRVFKCKATGVRRDMRAYGKIAALTVRTEEGEVYEPPFEDLVTLQAELLSENTDFTRVLHGVTRKPRRASYAMVVRAIKTRDFMTADPAPLSWRTLARVSQRVMDACPRVSSVYYDVTPKPPATIEFE